MLDILLTWCACRFLTSGHGPVAPRIATKVTPIDGTANQISFLLFARHDYGPPQPLESEGQRPSAQQPKRSAQVNSDIRTIYPNHALRTIYPYHALCLN